MTFLSFKDLPISKQTFDKYISLCKKLKFIKSGCLISLKEIYTQLGFENYCRYYSQFPKYFKEIKGKGINDVYNYVCGTFVKSKLENQRFYKKLEQKVRDRIIKSKGRVSKWTNKQSEVYAEKYKLSKDKYINCVLSGSINELRVITGARHMSNRVGVSKYMAWKTFMTIPKYKIDRIKVPCTPYIADIIFQELKQQYPGRFIIPNRKTTSFSVVFGSSFPI